MSDVKVFSRPALATRASPTPQSKPAARPVPTAHPKGRHPRPVDAGPIGRRAVMAASIKSTPAKARAPLAMPRTARARVPGPAPAPVPIAAPLRSKTSQRLVDLAAPIPERIPLRFLTHVGTRASLRAYWGEDCPNSYGRGNLGVHNAKIHLVDSDKLDDHELGGKPEDYADERWPIACAHCPAIPPAFGTTATCSCGCGQERPVVSRQVFTSAIFCAPNGELLAEHDMIAGDAYLSRWPHHVETGQCPYWDNCTGEHLCVILPPDEHPWDTSGRASNCTMKDDRLHRCWVVKGDPSKGELVTVGKNGLTCGAGAGSILTDRFHGMLENGTLRKC